MPKPKSPQEETQTVLQAVQTSGEVAPEVKDIVNQAADAAFVQTFGPSTPQAERSMSPSCFRIGCLVHVVYRDQCTSHAADEVLLERPSARLRKWPGGIYKTPAVRLADGRLDVTWALLLSAPEKQRQGLEALLKPPAPEPAILQREVCTSSANIQTGSQSPAAGNPSAAPATAPTGPNIPRTK
jgi:hypothetical protein